jgi:hypothetical protein
MTSWKHKYETCRRGCPNNVLSTPLTLNVDVLVRLSRLEGGLIHKRQGRLEVKWKILVEPFIHTTIILCWNRNKSSWRLTPAYI